MSVTQWSFVIQLHGQNGLIHVCHCKAVEGYQNPLNTGDHLEQPYGPQIRCTIIQLL